jgi:hypothetical protein
MNGDERIESHNFIRRLHHHHAAQMYMLPEVSKSGAARLYSTSREAFPTGWQLDTILVDEPLIDASLVPPLAGARCALTLMC